MLKKVMILYHQTTIKPKYQAMLHVNATAQTCQIISIDQINKKSKGSVEVVDDAGAQILRTGDRGLVRFRFMQRAEYLKEGTKLIFREGRTKGLGTVKEIFPVKEPVVTASSVSTNPDVVKTHLRSPTKDGGTRGSLVTVIKSHDRQNTGDVGKTLKA
jgi:Elongation factor Tu C-terminal domain